jgi:hypothetical protein
VLLAGGFFFLSTFAPQALTCVNPDLWKSTCRARICADRALIWSRTRNDLRLSYCFGMRARLHDYEETRIIIPTYLGVCIFICGVLGWGFYQLMQPAQYSNPGVAAYKAPPGLGITSLPRERTLPSVANASELEHTADETTGRATQRAVAPVPPPQTKSARKQEDITRPARERREATAQERRETHRVQQSAPVQSHPFAGFGAAYAGYAALH